MARGRHAARSDAGRSCAAGRMGCGERALEGGAEEVQDHHVVLPFDAVPANLRDTDAALEVANDLGLEQELRVAASHGLELDGHLLPGADVDAWLKRA